MNVLCKDIYFLSEINLLNMQDKKHEGKCENAFLSFNSSYLELVIIGNVLILIYVEVEKQKCLWMISGFWRNILTYFNSGMDS